MEQRGAWLVPLMSNTYLPDIVRDVKGEGICVDGKTLNYSHFFYEATSFESYWEKWFSVVEPYLLPDVKIKKAVGTNGR